MQFKETTVGNILVTTVLDNRIAEAVSSELKAALVAHFERHRGAVVLDLGEVSFIDSSGLAALVAVLKSLEGGNLVLCGLTGAVANMFKLTRMDKVFRIFPTAQDAVSALSDQG